MDRRLIGQGCDSFHNVFGTVPQYLTRDSNHNTNYNKLVRTAQWSYTKERFKESMRESSVVDLQNLRKLDQRCQWESSLEKKLRFQARENQMREMEEQYEQDVGRRKERLRKLMDEDNKMYEDEMRQHNAGNQLEMLRRKANELKQKREERTRALVREKLEERKRREYADFQSAIVKANRLEVSKDQFDQVENEDRQFADTMGEEKTEEAEAGTPVEVAEISRSARSTDEERDAIDGNVVQKLERLSL